MNFYTKMTTASKMQMERVIDTIGLVKGAMIGIKIILLASTLWNSQVTPGTQPTCNPAHNWTATSETDQVPESSGVIASRINQDIYWTHNNSGPYAPRVYAFRLSEADRGQRQAKDMGYVELENATNVDWEDIATRQGDIYILDGGDDPPCERSDKRIHRFKEPRFDVNGVPIRENLRADFIRWEYPATQGGTRTAAGNDDRYDAECLFAPRWGDFYIITKRDNRDRAVARVYRLATSRIEWNSTKIYVATLVRDISENVPEMITAGDISRSNDRVVIRSHSQAFEFVFHGCATFDHLFRQEPTVTSLPGESRGESICYGAGGKEWITTAVVKKSGETHFPVYITPIAK